MDTKNFPNNSNSAKQPKERKRLEKVTKGTAKEKEKSGLAKAASNFFESTFEDVATWIVKDVLKPAAKKTLYDVATGGLSKFFWDKSGRPSTGSTGSFASPVRHVAYESVSKSFSDPTNTQSGRSNYSDIVYETQDDANLVIDAINEQIRDYQIATVLDIYDAAGAGVSSTSADCNYGWTPETWDATRVRVFYNQSAGGYVIKWPKVHDIRK